MVVLFIWEMLLVLNTEVNSVRTQIYVSYGKRSPYKCIINDKMC